MRRWLTWRVGRQEGGYDKMLLWESEWLKCDLYLLRFPTGSYIKPHRDPVGSGRHYRLNIIVKRPERGGGFIGGSKCIVNWPRLKFFRPDLHKHGVRTILKGTRYVLSFGFVRR